MVTRGLAFYVLAFLMVPIGILFADAQGMSSVIFPILLLIFIAAGEIHVNAINYSLVGELIQPKHQGLLTGYLFVNIAVGVAISGPIANFAINNAENLRDVSAISSNPLYMKVFIVMAAISAVVTLIFFGITRFINKALEDIS